MAIVATFAARPYPHHCVQFTESPDRTLSANPDGNVWFFLRLLVQTPCFQAIVGQFRPPASGMPVCVLVTASDVSLRRLRVSGSAATPDRWTPGVMILLDEGKLAVVLSGSACADSADGLGMR